MIILGLILILDGIYIYYTRNKIKIKDKKDLNLRDIIIIGIAQGLAALPGVSRSGITVSTMLLMEYDPKFAFSLSYILYIPAALGAFFLTILASKSNIVDVASTIGYYGILTAIIVSFIVGYLTIGILMKLAKSKKIYYIDYILGSIAIIISLIGLIYG
jgi:undecaprenyl-diphosphatase